MEAKTFLSQKIFSRESQGRREEGERFVNRRQQKLPILIKKMKEKSFLKKKLFLYSSTIGVDRGIENFILEPTRIVFRYSSF